jgi:hypothetical protein
LKEIITTPPLVKVCTPDKTVNFSHSCERILELPAYDIATKYFNIGHFFLPKECHNYKLKKATVNVRSAATSPQNDA